MGSKTTHVRMYESDVEWLDEQFDDQRRADKLGRLIERYKMEEERNDAEL